MEAKHEFARSAPQKAAGIWNHGAGVVVTASGNIAIWVERFRIAGSESLSRLEQARPACRCL